VVGITDTRTAVFLLSCRAIDVALLNPVTAACYTYNFPGAAMVASAVSHLESAFPGTLAPSQYSGGVIVVRADSSIRTPADLRGKKISAYSFTSTGGLPQLYYLRERGLDPFLQASTLYFTPLNDRMPMRDVLRGFTDAALLASTTFFRLVHEGLLSLDDVRILDPVITPDNGTVVTGPYFFTDSVVGTLPWVPPILAAEIARALIALPEMDPALYEAGLHAFKVPTGTGVVDVQLAKLGILDVTSRRCNNVALVSALEEIAAQLVCPPDSRKRTLEELRVSCRDRGVECPVNPTVEDEWKSPYFPVVNYTCVCDPCIPNRPPRDSADLAIPLAIALPLAALVGALVLNAVLRARGPASPLSAVPHTDLEYETLIGEAQHYKVFTGRLRGQRTLLQCYLSPEAPRQGIAHNSSSFTQTAAKGLSLGPRDSSLTAPSAGGGNKRVHPLDPPPKKAPSSGSAYVQALRAAGGLGASVDELEAARFEAPVRSAASLRSGSVFDRAGENASNADSSVVAWSLGDALEEALAGSGLAVSHPHVHAKGRRGDVDRTLKLLGSLRSQHVVLAGHVAREGQHVIVLREDMVSGSLMDLMVNQMIELDLESRVGVAHDVAQGLQYLASLTTEPEAPGGVIGRKGRGSLRRQTLRRELHGRLVPSNVFLSGTMSAKLGIDLGLPLSSVGDLLSYTAPEVLRQGAEALAPAADVYALGVLMYDLVSARPLHWAYNADPARLVRDVLSGALAPEMAALPDTVPLGYKVLISACLSHDPRLRPPIQVAADQLEGLLAEVAAQPRAASPHGAPGLMDKVFPPDVKEQLLRGQKVEPRFFKNVTVFFSDIVGFTTLSAQLTPQKVMNLLDRLYKRFDKITEQLQLFKVETSELHSKSVRFKKK
jgi:hypothetical protein